MRSVCRSIVVGVLLLLSSIPFQARAMTQERRSLRVFATGPSESGKNRILYELFTKRTARVLTIDFKGEVRDQDPNALPSFGLNDTRETLKRLATVKRWRIAAHLDPDECAPLFRMLMPRVKSANTTSYAREVGGMAIECGECSLLAPNGRTPQEIREAPFSGRHFLLSLYLATQAPASIDRSLTGQSQVLIAFGHREEVEVEYWRRRTSRAVADIISELPQYHSIFYTPASGRVKVLDESYRPYRVLDLKGREIASRGLRLERQS